MPRKRGNRPEDPAEGREHRHTGTFEGQTGGDIGLHNRVNETRGDSEAGA